MSTAPGQDGSDRGERQKREVENMRALMASEGNQAGWDQAWKRGVTPWETMLGNIAQPSLRWACEQEERASALIPRAGRALVPGCGRGQDVAYLARRGLDAIGLDISPNAVEAASQWLARQAGDDDGDWINRAHVRCVDYFELSSGPVSDSALTGVDLIYDYTFFCAIPPELHSSWANSHAAALRPGGILVCLVFPLRPTGDDSQNGPPFFVTPEIYTDLLKDRFTLEFHQTPDQLPAHKVGKETVMIWRRK